MGGVLRYKLEVYSADKLYGLGVPEQCPVLGLQVDGRFRFKIPALLLARAVSQSKVVAACWPNSPLLQLLLSCRPGSPEAGTRSDEDA